MIDAVDATLRALRALSDPTRLRIASFLAEPVRSCCSHDDGVCGCDLEAVLGLAQPTVSHHMKQLVEAGLVHSEKRGRWTYYELNSGAFDALAAEFARLARAAESTATTRNATGPVDDGSVEAGSDHDTRATRPTTS